MIAPARNMISMCRGAFAAADYDEEAGRLKALDRLMDVDFKGVGREDWKYGSMEEYISDGFTPQREPKTDVHGEVLLPPTQACCRLVFVDGHYISGLSSRRELPNGVTISPRASAAETPEFGQLTAGTDAPFTLLNETFWRDVVLVRLDDGVSLEEPIELCYMVGPETDRQLVPPRVLIVAGRESRATVIERFIGAGNHLCVPVGEIHCGQAAQIRHIKLMHEGTDARHVGATYVRQAGDSRYLSHEIALGGALTRRELHVDLVERGAVCELRGLGMGRDTQRIDLRTRVTHSAPGCETRELYKNILDDSANAVFDGLIHVAKDAQQTEARQTNRNLLLSETAKSYSIPRLEIYADDVKCSHGSTTGQLEDDQIFYMRSRGFDSETARVFLAGAFAGEVLDSMQPETLRREMTSEIADRLGMSPAVAQEDDR